MKMYYTEYGLMSAYDLEGIGYERYDWLSPNSKRTPEEYPYSHSEYYLWRDFDKNNVPEGVSFYYTDRMSSWDYEKWQSAAKGRVRNYGSVPHSKADAQRIVEAYFGREFKCVGIIQSMNVSNGYPLGVFCVKKKV